MRIPGGGGGRKGGRGTGGRRGDRGEEGDGNLKGVALMISDQAPDKAFYNIFTVIRFRALSCEYVYVN